MVDRHDPQRDPTLSLLPRHPVRYRSHIDRCEHGIAQNPPFQQVFAAADRMVKTHILIHRQCYFLTSIQLNDLNRFFIIHTKWLLGEYAADVRGFDGNLSQDFRLTIWRNCNINHLQFRIPNQLMIIRIYLWYFVTPRNFAGLFGAARSNRHRVEPGFSIRNKMAICHDESCPDTTNRPVEQIGEWRVDIQFRELG